MRNSISNQSMLAIILAGFLFSCGDVDSINNEDPINLIIEISLADDSSGIATIKASAENAIMYSLYIDSGESPVLENTLGEFMHTFIRTGIYQVEVRAFGVSGRYIREVRQIEVTVGKDVSVDDGYISSVSYEGYDLTWNDEFEGNNIKHENWSFETGTGCPNCGWGNNELQYYRQENAWVGDGVLTIEAREEKYQSSNYTSARLITRNLRSFKYGRIDIRALLPKGQGIWPALWMLGNNLSSVGWPQSGEIDIMEMVGGGGRENQIHGTIHWDEDGNHAQTGSGYTLTSGTYADKYHVFSILWDESAIKWYIDDTEFYDASITSENMSEFHQEFFFIFNIAVGGNWPGNPDSQTVFPQRMKVDYVRVFQKKQ